MEEEVTISEALQSISRQLKWLGTGDAATRMGAIEALGKAILDGSERVAGAIDNLAEVVRETVSTEKAHDQN